MLDDTIVAISTPPGFGGLGIVRLSGKKSLAIVKTIFKPKQRSFAFQAKKPVLGFLSDPETQDVFDEVYLIFFPAPHTYTCEDMVEISCHGSPVILEEVIRLCVKAGARHAGPGEFTLRAHVNGRIDILQAEAIRDLIEAASMTQVKISFLQMEGRLSRKARELRARIIHLLSQIEAVIEFPEDGLRVTSKQILTTLEKTILQIKSLVKSYDIGKTLSEGMILAIAGRPNVGKSTLFNTLLDYDRAIVSPHAGTTRDILREKTTIVDSVFTLVDMAGLAEASKPVEKEGVRRGKKATAEADGILLMVDAAENTNKEDEKLITQLNNKKMILILNKCDLPIKKNINRLRTIAPGIEILEISALKKQNIDQLRQVILKTFVPEQKKGEDIILHLRQKLILENILTILFNTKKMLLEGYSEEYYVEEFKAVLPLFGQLSGEIRSEEILQDIFGRFCVGK